MNWISSQLNTSGASKSFFSVSPPWGLSCVNSQREKHCTLLGMLKTTNEKAGEKDNGSVMERGGNRIVSFRESGVNYS